MAKGTPTRNSDLAERRDPIEPGPVIVNCFRLLFASDLLAYVSKVLGSDGAAYLRHRAKLARELDGLVHAVPVPYAQRNFEGLLAIVEGYLLVTECPECNEFEAREIAEIARQAYQAVVTDPPAGLQPDTHVILDLTSLAVA